MKAKQFRENSFITTDFTKLTSTGISTDYEKIEQFAELYHESCMKSTDNVRFSYILDLEARCEKANFAPFSLRVPKEVDYFVWNAETIKNAEDWLKKPFVI
jgi:hypothetical protein